MATAPKPDAAEAPSTPAAPERLPETRDARTKVSVRDTITGRKLQHTVPVAWLDGRFPRLAETPSSRQEGN